MYQIALGFISVGLLWSSFRFLTLVVDPYTPPKTLLATAGYMALCTVALLMTSHYV